MQVTCNPVTNGMIQAINLTKQGVLRSVSIHGFFTPDLEDSNLNQKEIESLFASFSDVSIIWNLEKVAGARDRAAGVTIVAETDSGIMFGYSELAEGKSLKKLSVLIPEAIKGLLRNISNDKFVCVDEFLQDQLIIFMALAQGTSVVHCGPLTLHTKTAIFFCSKITGAEFLVERMDQPETLDVLTNETDYEKNHPESRFRLTAKGIGFRPNKK